MTKRVVRVGGVHEPFNLPWILAFEADAFAELDIEVTFSTYAGGTGELVGALEDGFIDLATDKHLVDVTQDDDEIAATFDECGNQVLESLDRDPTHLDP